MKIITLESQNVKRLTAVQIKPDGSIVVIGGKNAAGKTSVLDSIMFALAGGKAVAAEPIKRGEEEARITLDLGEFVVERTFNRKTGTSLKVTNGVSGVKVTSPQKMLDDLTAKIAFDPITFARMPALAQFEELRKLLGLDFAVLDADRARIYNERTVKNREVDNQRVRVTQMPHHVNAPDKAPDTAEIIGRLRKAEEWNEENRKASEALANAQQEAVAAAQKMAEIEEQIARLKTDHAHQIRLRDQALQTVATSKEASAREDVDLAPINESLAQVAEVRSQVEANQRRGEELQALRTLEKASGEMTALIEAIDGKKAKMITEAKFPIDGLGFAEQGVTFNGIPFDQASEAEKLRVSVAMGMAMNPKLKVLLIRDGSLLDTDNLALIGQMAEENGAQVWIERVGDGKECQIIIDDGKVAEDRTAT